MAEFDWVKARAECTAEQIFEKLKLQVKEDVDIRNTLRREDSPYKFTVEDRGRRFMVKLQGNDLPNVAARGVTFRLGDESIDVADYLDGVLFTATLTLNDEGECLLSLLYPGTPTNRETVNLWQFRRRALEATFFGIV